MVQDIGTPNLTHFVQSQIDYLDKEHKILFLRERVLVEQLDSLKSALERISQYDIDSSEIANFKKSFYQCKELTRKTWSNQSYTLTISSFNTNEKNNDIELVKITICSKSKTIELFTKSNDPLEYLKINEKQYHPIYESRAIGVEKAIKTFKLLEKNGCR
ncbi:hypothetical protein [uncultured Winogradskyella sp.]|uniref:hypothetical protein n=1 Tax=uncultured Winogradskyella sp. TaxID=395353 RepID=UPI00261250AB|nr:hypothetical protein [uncultured Winogradskyella sp.]